MYHTAASRISCWLHILAGCGKRLCQVTWFSKNVLRCSRDVKTTGGWLPQKTPPLSNNAWLYSDQTHCVFWQGFLCLRLALSLLCWPILVWILLLNSFLNGWDGRYAMSHSLCGDGDQIQGSVHVRQAFCKLSHVPSSRCTFDHQECWWSQSLLILISVIATGTEEEPGRERIMKAIIHQVSYVHII